MCVFTEGLLFGVPLLRWFLDGHGRPLHRRARVVVRLRCYTKQSYTTRYNNATTEHTCSVAELSAHGVNEVCTQANDSHNTHQQTKTKQH